MVQGCGVTVVVVVVVGVAAAEQALQLGYVEKPVK
jgi:hypothetical protein